MRIIYLDIIDIARILMYNYEQNRTKLGVIFRCLKQKNPEFYKSLKISDTKDVISTIFPIHKNNRKNCKNFKISKIQLNRFINQNQVKIRPFKDVNRLHYGFNKC